MPYARISLLRGHPPAYLRALSASLYQAMHEAFDVPAGDCFQVIHQHDPDELVFDRHYLGGPRSDGFVLIAITAGRERSNACKQAFYRRLVELLAIAPGIAPEDVMVTIVTTAAQDWSFGGGRAGITARGVPA
ncbi:tautomerase family protein [Xanthomonas sp. LF06-19]|uniref:tautomerase family protein n=1 Tax=Xanthomonas sp. LF06-19 TaxID=3097551 RepID=UPI0025DAAFF5|nr:tautomerase family protein [Xanthomonas sp. LF06-19]MDY4284531.1 tautomerase family protein [Xanthomonas sp. LF06-19]